MARTISRKQRLVASTSAFAVLAGITLAAYSDWAEMETEFTTGTFGIAIDGDEGNPVPYSVAFDASDLNPGDTAETLVDLQNTGTIDADVALVATTADTGSGEDEAFLDALLGSYSTDGGASWSSEVPLTELTTDADIFLQGGESAPFAVRVHFEEGAGNAAQGGRVGVNFRFEAEQSMGGDIPGFEDGAVGLLHVPGVVFYSLSEDLHLQGAYGHNLPVGWQPLFEQMESTEAIFDVLNALSDGYYPDGWAHEDSPYRLSFDGSESDLPGLRQVGGTADAPIFAWTPEIGEWVVGLDADLINRNGEVVETTSHEVRVSVTE